jgi:ABC-type arginine/histidine transport system permease subunit
MEGGYSMCPINSFNNIEAWQNALRAIPIKNILSLILLSLIFLVFISLSIKEIQRLYEKYIHIKIRLYGKLIPTHPIPLFVFLFSEGILNTKSY